MQRIVALAGNPNTGKSSLFNALTGSNQHVGNWPGVTVERKEGRLSGPGGDVLLVDLPGTYSLGAASPEEEVTAAFLLESRPDLVVAVVDASSLERSLYLAVQVLEAGLPTVVALNMNDAAEERGVHADPKVLSSLLGIPVAITSGRSRDGAEELRQTIFRELGKMEDPSPFTLPLGEKATLVVDRLESILRGRPPIISGISARTSAVWIAERNPLALAALEREGLLEDVESILSEEGRSILDSLGYDLETALIERRWGFVSGIAREAVRRDLSLAARLSISDRIDRVATSRFWGPLLFLFASLGMFRLTYALGDPLGAFVEKFFRLLGERSASLLSEAGLPLLLASFLRDGILGGAGSVLAFFPHIFLLFSFIAVLEDSGYMARGAFVMDRFMHLVGLHGKSFMPMVMGFGCTVPSMMATRILDSSRDRMVTLLVLPFISCSAKLPVFVLFSGIFFGKSAGTAVFSLYILGMAAAGIAARILGGTLFRGQGADFVLELPPYHVPSLRMVMRHAWEKGEEFLRKAGTFILISVVAIWMLASLPPGAEYGSPESVAGRMGMAVAPLLAPAGFGFWQAGVALLFGFLAKEVVAGTFGALLGGGEAGIAGALQGLFTPLSAYSFLVMTLLYVPCAASLAAFRRETGSWKWTFFLVLYTAFTAWAAATLIYQGGRLLGLR